MIKFRFFSFRLIFAITQPSRQESSSTITETSTVSRSEPRTDSTVGAPMTKYTSTAGSITVAEYISPVR